jgi:hypothetical protein
LADLQLKLKKIKEKERIQQMQETKIVLVNNNSEEATSSKTNEDVCFNASVQANSTIADNLKINKRLAKPTPK